MLWVYGIDHLLGTPNVPYIMTPILIIMLLVPFIDRNPETNPAKRKIMIALLIAGLLLFGSLTIFGAMRTI